VARYWCQRCEAELNTLDSELHLCKDIIQRGVRRQAQREAVIIILNEYGRNDLGIVIDDEQLDDVADDIVRKLSQMGVQND
jgi:hypothetical protein